jgi:hypothetical protein
VAVPFDLPFRYRNPQEVSLGAFYMIHLANTGTATVTQIKPKIPGALDWCIEIDDGSGGCTGRSYGQTPIPDLAKGESVDLRVWARGTPITAAGSGLRITHFDGDADLTFVSPREDDDTITSTFVFLTFMLTVTLAAAVYSALSQKRIADEWALQFQRMRADGLKIENEIKQQLDDSKERRLGKKPWTDPATGNTYPSAKPEGHDANS